MRTSPLFTFLLLQAFAISFAAVPARFVPLALDTPLNDIIAVTTRSEQPHPRTGCDEAIYQALALLGQWPKISAKEEHQIELALTRATDAGHPRLRNVAAWSLGARGRTKALSPIFDRLETEPDLFRCFFYARTYSQAEVSLSMLRKGLGATSPDARAAALEVIGLCGSQSLSKDIVAMLVAGQSAVVRNQAAVAAWRLKAPGTADALLRLVQAGIASPEIVFASIELGEDEHARSLLSLLWDKSAELRSMVAQGLGCMYLKDHEPACIALRHTLRDSSTAVRISAAKSLGRFHDVAAIPILREILPESGMLDVPDRRALVQSVAEIGGPECIMLLNDMLRWRYRSECGLEQILASKGDPSSGRAAWAAYLADPIHTPPGDDFINGGYTASFAILENCADADLLPKVRERAAVATRKPERLALERVAEKITARLGATATSVDPNAPKWSLPALVPELDSDGDGVPDVRDKWPHDRRRSEEIPVHYIAMPTKAYATIPIGVGDEDPLFMAIDDASRVGYVATFSSPHGTDYTVATVDPLGRRKQWTLPSLFKAGDDVAHLSPSSVNAEGVTVGTATRVPANRTGDKSVDSPPVQPQVSGFILKDGILKLDPPPPFRVNTTSCTYKKVNNRGLIFGHRELFHRGVGTMVAFLGTHYFHGAPAFEVTALTETGKLLCYWGRGSTVENRVWDGSRFLELGSLFGKPENVRPYAMNEKLQVVGLSDWVQRDQCPTGFFWENGKMVPFIGLIPEEHRIWMRSAIPYLISDSGNIRFITELRGGRGMNEWRKASFALQFAPSGKHTIEEMRSY